MLGPVKKVLLTAAGILSLGTGIVGAFVPLLPTVPLVLLAAFCFARSSKRLHNWLLTHPMFCRIIRDFEAGRGVERRVKVRAIALIIVSMTYSGWMVGRPTAWLGLLVIGSLVAANIWRLPEKKSTPERRRSPLPICSELSCPGRSADCQSPADARFRHSRVVRW